MRAGKRKGQSIYESVRRRTIRQKQQSSTPVIQPAKAGDLPFLGARCKAQKYGPPELGREDTISAMDRACRDIKDLQAAQDCTHHLTCDISSPLRSARPAQKCRPPKLGKEDTTSAMDRACKHIRDSQASSRKCQHNRFLAA